MGALVSALASAMVGYGLAKFAFRGRDFIFGMILAGVLVPGIVLAIPQYPMTLWKPDGSTVVARLGCLTKSRCQ